MHPNVHSSSIYSCQDWKQPKCAPTDEGIRKMYILSFIWFEYEEGVECPEVYQDIIDIRR